jgi:hypothetical protein
MSGDYKRSRDYTATPVSEEFYRGIEPQERRPIANLFGDIQWTYVGQMENQDNSRAIPIVRDVNGVPVEFVDAYSSLSIMLGYKKASREYALEIIFMLVLSCFVPQWAILLAICCFAYAAYHNQVEYRKALALADQFYDRTIGRYKYEVMMSRPKNMEVIKRVVRL